MGIAAEPLLRDLPGGPEGERYRKALARAAAFFNSHPYLAGLAVGAAARAEHDGASPAEVERLRTALCSPLGSMGDRLIWAGWLPCASAAAMAAAAFDLRWTAVAVLLAAYNLVHLPLRWWALAAGWQHGVRVVGALRHPLLQHGLRVVRPLAAVSLGFALPLVAATLVEGLGGAEDTRLWVAGTALAGFLVMRTRLLPLSSLGVGLVATGMALVAGWLWR
jgi:mannose PTS system EIID component